MSIKELLETTELTYRQIGARLGISRSTVYRYISINYTEEYRQARAAKMFSNCGCGGWSSKKVTGSVVKSGAYLWQRRPDWYTGDAAILDVCVHRVVLCAGLGITEIPDGWVGHHCDEDKFNNDFNNLVLMRRGDHQRLHVTMRGTALPSKAETLQWIAENGTPWAGT